MNTEKFTSYSKGDDFIYNLILINEINLLKNMHKITAERKHNNHVAAV